MTFAVAGEAYDRFMGRYSIQLAPQLVELVGVTEGQSVLDVGCGPGALTGALVERVGAENVAAVDPSEPFVAEARRRQPEVDVREAPAESLPFETASFDAALAQLVVHFMSDPVAGLREMARVTRPGGVVAASVWDLAGGRAPISVFWRAARESDPNALDESRSAGGREGHLTALFEEAGLREIAETAHEASLELASFEDWWDPFTLGVGPAGAYAVGLDEDRREALRERCRALLPEPPFVLRTYAWAARGTVAD